LVAAVTPEATSSWTPPLPPRLEVYAFDRELARRWQFALPATAPRTRVAEVRRDVENVVVELQELTDRWRRRSVVVDAATGRAKRGASSAVWVADLVASGDDVGGAKVTTETWTEEMKCPLVGFEGGRCTNTVDTVTSLAAAIRRPR
jgi:hypothetical protein